MIDFYVIGKIVRISGLKGAVVVEAMTANPDRFRALQRAWVKMGDEQYRPLDVGKASVQAHNVKLEFKGIDDRSGAAALVGKMLCVTKEDLIEKEDGTYFIHEIVGSTMLDEQGKRIGEVTEVWKLPANDVYVVRSGKREHLIPAVRAVLRKIDTERKTIEIQTMEGLLD